MTDPVLLDASVLIALTFQTHEHHQTARAWATDRRLSICPIVEGALVRYAVRAGESPASIRVLLEALHAHPRVEFWADDVSYRDIDLTGVRGHKQVTDSYLARLAEAHGARLATLDRSLAARLPELCEALPAIR